MLHAMMPIRHIRMDDCDLGDSAHVPSPRSAVLRKTASMRLLFVLACGSLSRLGAHARKAVTGCRLVGLTSPFFLLSHGSFHLTRSLPSALTF
eukprot:1494050-Pleurochrysis_carterae.AAC.2